MADPGRPLRILVVDDHEVVRQGLVALLDRRAQFQVVGQAGAPAEALTQTRRFVPDVVLMDVQLPDASGIEACRMVRDEFPAMPVVPDGSRPDRVDVFAAIVAERGYVVKQSRSAARNGRWRRSAGAQSLQAWIPPSHGPGPSAFRLSAAEGTDEASHLTHGERRPAPLVAVEARTQAGRSRRCSCRPFR
jgi:DNA-binding NarL/FixJ family response regulator